MVRCRHEREHEQFKNTLLHINNTYFYIVFTTAFASRLWCQSCHSAYPFMNIGAKDILSVLECYSPLYCHTRALKYNTELHRIQKKSEYSTRAGTIVDR